MSQNFVVTFGGSGARCAEAVTYLAAARCISEPMHVLIVDPDESNWNVSRSLEQLRRYQRIQSQVALGHSDGHRAFFTTPINEGLGADSFFWANPQATIPFETVLGYASLQSSERDLFDLLYDDSDLALTFERGYVGRAHIGSLDLLRALRERIEAAALPEVAQHDHRDSLQQFFRSLREATQRPGGARLLVIGSVFGGTGASGLPAIPPLLQQTLASGLQKDLKIGCVQLAHYFSFPQGRPEDPDSALHPLATQSALYHYALTDTGYDRIYLLGAPDREHANQNNVAGGEGQRNRPHYVELGAALAVAHFFSEAIEPAAGTEVLACGSDQVIWDKLPYREKTDLRRNLVAFTTFCMAHGEYMAKRFEDQKHLGEPWYEDLKGQGRNLGGQQPEIRELKEFALRFLNWAADVQRCSGVNLFAFDASAKDKALGQVSAGSRFQDPYHEFMKRLNRVRKVDQANGVGWYVGALTAAAVDFCSANYPSWWL